MNRPESIRGWYQQRIDECTERLAVRRRQDDWLTRLRVATFLPAIGLAIFGVFYAVSGRPWLVAAAALVAAFIVVVRVHERILRDAEELRQRLRMNEIQLARLDRQWDRVSTSEVAVPPEREAVANDLDLFGRASLYQLVSLAHTPFGRETLRDWLLAPASPAEILERQQAVAFLAPATGIREEIDVRGRMLEAQRNSTLAFVAWAEAPPVLATRPRLTWLTRMMTAAMVLTVIGGFAGIVSVGSAFLTSTVLACLNLVLFACYGGRIYDVLERVASRSHDIQQYRPLMETIADLPPEIPMFAQLHAHMGASPQEPLRRLANLMRLVRFANLRRDGLVGLLYYFSQLFLLTDFHVLALMERWQQRHGTSVRRWLEVVGRVEALSSLATLAHDNPHWCIPDVARQPDTRIVAKQLGHPLIADAARVPNDVEIGPAGTFVVVTGSNMSGKSTLLRAVGMNVALAQAGGPVCASEFRMPPVELATSMRTRDSLADGVSFFLAELRRLKQIVDQSRSAQQQNSRTLLYLLDEILQGTNSAERHIAVLRVIGHLVAHGSIGMVSTHDLELARSPELTTACRTVHFHETITSRADGQEQMTFDYLLRPGLAPTTNALKLLKFVGLDE
jgi:energy-coupling factor transporter ATP-binding protein EcfA2